VPPEQTEGQISDYTKLGSSPGGGRPTFTKCRRIFLTSCGSVITARIRIGEPHLKKHILKDPFARKRLSEITRANVLDLRSRLLAKNAPARVIKALGIVKVIFREALFREEINRDPTAGVGRVKYCKVERGIFTAEELRTLFPDHGYGPWKDIQDYTPASTWLLSRGCDAGRSWPFSGGISTLNGRPSPYVRRGRAAGRSARRSGITCGWCRFLQERLTSSVSFRWNPSALPRRTSYSPTMTVPV